VSGCSLALVRLAAWKTAAHIAVIAATSADERRHEQAQLGREVRLAEPGELRRVDG
jgi:hypothetical protein